MSCVPCSCIRDFLDPAVDGDPLLAADYELDARTVCRLTRVLDIVTPDSTRSMCFTKAYGSYAEVGYDVHTCDRLCAMCSCAFDTLSASDWPPKRTHGSYAVVVCGVHSFCVQCALTFLTCCDFGSCAQL